MPDDAGVNWQERFNRLEGRLQDLTNMVAEVRSLVGPWAVNLADGHLLVHTLHKLLLIVDSLGSHHHPATRRLQAMGA